MSVPPHHITPAAAYRVSPEELRQIIEYFEHLQAEKDELTTQQKALLANAKSRGYDTKAIRALIALRKRDIEDVAEQEAVEQMYREALGIYI